MKNTFGAILNTICLFLITLSISDCKKTNNNELPPITQSGQNTIGCKINGVNWVPYIPCSISVPTAALQYHIYSLDSVYKTPLLFSVETASRDYIFLMQQNGHFSDHIYRPGNIVDSIDIICIGPQTTYYNYNHFWTSADRYFTITKLDTLNNIISGIFSLTLYGQIGAGFNDSLILTDGRFDFKIGDFYDCSH